MRGALQMIFYLILILILVVYWDGAKNLVSSFGEALNKIIMTLQGRNNSSGEFQNYPS